MTNLLFTRYLFPETFFFYQQQTFTANRLCCENPAPDIQPSVKHRRGAYGFFQFAAVLIFI